MTHKGSHTEPLKNLLAVGGGIFSGAMAHKPRSEDETLYRVVGIRALENNRVNHEAVESRAITSDRDVERARIHEGDIIISRVIPYKIALVDEGCEGYILSQNLFILRFREGIDAGLVAEYLNSPMARREIASHSHGSTFATISIAALRELPVPCLTENTRRYLVACLKAYRDYEDLARQEETLVNRIRETLVAEYLEVQ